MNKHLNMLILTIFLVGQLVISPLSAVTASASTLDDHSVDRTQTFEASQGEENEEDVEEAIDSSLDIDAEETQVIENIEEQHVETVIEETEKESPLLEESSGTDPPYAQRETVESEEELPHLEQPNVKEEVEESEERSSQEMDATEEGMEATTSRTSAKKPIDSIVLNPKIEPLSKGGVARVDVNWSIADGSYKPGDHFTIELPTDLSAPTQTLAGDYLVCTPSNFTLHCVFTEKVAGATNVSGEIWYETMYLPTKNSGQTETKEEEGTFIFESEGDIFTNSAQVIVPGIPIEGPGQHQTHRDLQKFAGDIQWKYDEHNNKIMPWIVEVNGDLKTNLGETTYVDRLGPGHEVIPESIQVSVVHSKNGPTGNDIVKAPYTGPEPTVVVDSDLKGFKVTFADDTLSGYRADIRYDTKVTNENVAKWVNHGDVSNDKYNAGSDASYTNTASGIADRGENETPNTVKLVKVEGDVNGPGIEGVEFLIFNQQGEQVAKTLYPTTHNGVASIWNPEKGEKLEPGVYYATEILGEHNAKYDVDPDKRHYFVIENNEGTVLTVINELKEEVKTDIKVTKKWENDSVEQRPHSISVQVYQNGKPFGEAHEVTATENWTKIVRGLPKYDTEGNAYHYTIEEVNVPDGYTSTVQGYTITNTYEEQKQSQEIELVKRDAKDETIVLAGAVFELFNERDESQGTYTTNVEGKIVVTDLQEGEYYFVEKKAPLGYELSTEKHIVQDGKVVVTNEKVVEIEKTFTYAVHKIDAETKKPLQGVQFELQTTDGEVVRTGETNAAGNLTFTKLPEGEYVFVEVAPLDGYVTLQGSVVAEKDQTVTIENEKIPVQPEEPEPKVELTKIDSKEHDEVLEGAQFELYQIVDGEDILVMNGEEKNFTTDQSGKIIVENLIEGQYYFIETKAPKGYLLNEEKQYFTILKDNNITKLTVENEKESIEVEGPTPVEPESPTPVEPESPTPVEPEEPKPEVELTKVDSNNHDKVLAGAQFELYQVLDGEAVQVKNGESSSFETDEFGKIIVKDLPVGEYYFIETKAPKGYELNKEKQHFVISDEENTTKITVENEKRSTGGGGGGTPPTDPESPTPVEPEEPKPEVELTKVDSKNHDNVLSGAQFELYQVVDGEAIQVKNGESATFETDEVGKIVVKDLAVGQYYFIETKAPNGYVLNEEKQYFTISKDENVTKLTVENEKESIEVEGPTPVEPENPTPVEPEDPKPEVELTKVDSKNHDNVLSGAQFELYQVVDGKAIQVKNGDRAIFETDEHGKIVVKNLAVGEYYFVETKAPKGYQLNREKQPFTISKDENVTKLTVENKKRSSGGGGGSTPPTDPENPMPIEPEEPTPSEPEEPTPVEPEEPTPSEPEEPTPVEPEEPTPSEPEEPTPVEPEEPTPSEPEEPTPVEPEEPTPSEPEEPTPVEPENPTSSNSTQSSSVEQLPQTGEELYVAMKYIGIALLVIGSMLVIRRRVEVE